LDEIDLKSSTSKIRSRLRAPNPTMIPIFFLKIRNELLLHFTNRTNRLKIQSQSSVVGDVVCSRGKLDWKTGLNG
jgi:hypothetical protein